MPGHLLFYKARCSPHYNDGLTDSHLPPALNRLITRSVGDSLHIHSRVSDLNLNQGEFSVLDHHGNFHTKNVCLVSHTLMCICVVSVPWPARVPSVMAFRGRCWHRLGVSWCGGGRGTSTGYGDAQVAAVSMAPALPDPSLPFCRTSPLKHLGRTPL